MLEEIEEWTAELMEATASSAVAGVDGARRRKLTARVQFCEE